MSFKKEYIYLKQTNYASVIEDSEINQTLDKAAGKVNKARELLLKDIDLESYRKALQKQVDDFKDDFNKKLETVKITSLKNRDWNKIVENLFKLMKLEKPVQQKTVNDESQRNAEIDKRVEKILEIRRTKIWGINDYDVLTEAANEINKEFKAIMKLLSNNEVAKDLFSSEEINSLNKNKSSILEKIKKIRQIVFGIDISNFVGQYSEEIASFVKNDVTSQIKNAIVGEVVGGERSSITKKGKNGEELNGTATQNKVDIIVNMPSGTINASVKSTQQKRSSHRPNLQDVDLTTNLLSLSNDFFYHWVNLHMGNFSSLKKYKKEIDNIAQSNIAYEALAAGNLTKREQNIADTFIHIDWAKGKVYVEKTGELLKDINNFIFNPNVSTLDYSKQNRKREGKNKELGELIKKRQNDVLSTLHKQKISVALKVPVAKS